MVSYEVGRYRCTIEAQELREGNMRPDGTQGAPSVVFTVRPTARYEDQSDELSNWTPPETAYPRNVYLPLTDGTLGSEQSPGWVLQTLRWLGWEGTSFADFDQETLRFSAVGLEVDCWCKHEAKRKQENSKWVETSDMREVWSFLRPSGDRQASKPLPQKGIKALDSKFAKLLKATAPKATPQQQPQQQRAQAPARPTRQANLRPSAVAKTEPADSYPTDDDIPF